MKQNWNNCLVEFWRENKCYLIGNEWNKFGWTDWCLVACETNPNENETKLVNVTTTESKETSCVFETFKWWWEHLGSKVWIISIPLFENILMISFIENRIWRNSFESIWIPRDKYWNYFYPYSSWNFPSTDCDSRIKVFHLIL